MATSDFRSRLMSQDSHTISGAIGRPQMASVTRNRRASGDSDSSRAPNIPAKVGDASESRLAAPRIQRHGGQQTGDQGAGPGGFPAGGV